MPVGAARYQIIRDRILPGAIQRTGAAPGIAHLGIAARPNRNPLQELHSQELRLARHRHASSIALTEHLASFETPPARAPHDDVLFKVHHKLTSSLGGAN